MSIKTKIMCGLLAFGAAATTYAQERFNVYGFMDLNYQQRIGLDDANPLLGENFIENEPSVTTGNVNLYFDFNPTPNTRALVEVNFNSETQEESSRAGTSDDYTFEAFTAEQEALLTAIGPDGQPIMGADGPMSIADIRAIEGQVETVPIGTADQIVAGYQGQIAQGIQANAKLQNTEYRNRSFHKGIDLERAWMEYSLSDAVNFRFGQFITPAGIWNVDHGSPIITTVSQPNQTSFFPIFPERQQGVMALGTVFVGDHDLTYNAYVSTGRMQPSPDGVGAVDADQDLGFDDFAAGGHVRMNFDMLDGIRVGASGMMGTIRDDERTRYVRQFTNEEQMGLLSGTFEPSQKDFVNFSIIPQTYQKEYIGGLDFKLDHEGLTLQGEVNYRYLVNQIRSDFALPGAYTEYLGYYGLVSYLVRMNDTYSVTPYGLFEQITWDQPQNTARGLANFPIDGWNSYMAGLNFGLGSNLRFKIEYVYGQLLVKNPKSWAKPINNAEPLQDLDYEQGDLDLHTVNAQFTMAF